jgi:NaMN:DMB phosphoribosyltransferase
MQLANVTDSLGTISVATGRSGRREGLDREALVTMGGRRNEGSDAEEAKRAVRESCPMSR